MHTTVRMQRSWDDFRNEFSPSTIGSGESNSGHQAWEFKVNDLESRLSYLVSFRLVWILNGLDPVLV